MTIPMTGIILPYRDIAPSIAATAYIAPTAAVAGDVVVGAGSSLWFGVVARGDVNHIRIGERTNLQDGTIIHVTGGGDATHIGDGVTVGHLALLHACTLESGAFVGMRACVMDGAVVEGGAMVAAGALVTPGKRVPTGQLWAGSPARHMRDMTAEETAYLPVLAEKYVKLAAEYRERAGTPPPAG